MLERILSFEESWFHSINQSHSSALDLIMWSFSGVMAWIPLLLVILFVIYYKPGWREWLPIVCGIVLVSLICAAFTSYVCKPYFSRFRPMNHPLYMDEVNVIRGYIASGLYGFISGHSATSFGFAVFTSDVFKNKIYRVLIFAWAVLMSFSRIYLGAHFISDVVAGMLAGIFFGWLVYQLYRKVVKRFDLQRLKINN